MNSFADALREARKKRGLSQEDLADILGVSRQAISKWELGEGYPEVEKLIQLAKQLDVSLDSLLLDKPPQSEAPKQVTGKVWIRSFDNKTIIHCYKVMTSQQFNSQEGSPKYALFGVDGQSFFGENTTVLGWYTDEEAIQKEISQIVGALTEGVPFYQLQYAAKVKAHWWGVKLVETDK